MSDDSRIGGRAQSAMLLKEGASSSQMGPNWSELQNQQPYMFYKWPQNSEIAPNFIMLKSTSRNAQKQVLFQI